MGKPWDEALPRATINRREIAKGFTIVMPYYENPCWLGEQVAIWCKYPENLLGRVAFILVDDGSPTIPLSAALSMEKQLPRANFRAFRLDVDKRWNWLAARNIGAHYARPGWMLLTDIDHVIPPETVEALCYGDHDSGTIYAFSRREHTGESLHAHPNSWFITREMFWRVGGYDETLSGYYGTDGDWRRRMAAVASIHLLPDALVRHEHIGDSSTTRYLRKQPEDARVRELIALRGRDWKPKTLSFPYHEIELPPEVKSCREA